MWPDRRLTDLLATEFPIVQAPMAGAMDGELVVAACEGGALGSLPCAILTPDQVSAQFEAIRARTSRPINLNFFCHKAPVANNAREAAWRERLAPYYRELTIDPGASAPSISRAPFDAAMCDAVASLRPEVVSFHYGLPEPGLVRRLKEAGCKILSSATTVDEAIYLEAHGADAVIAQGLEAGGHRGMFLTEDAAAQVGTFALVPQVVDAVSVPVIAAGGIADGRGIAAAFALGAAGVQMGSVYLSSIESKIAAPFRDALARVKADQTVLTNVFSGRPARAIVNRLVREVGPMAAEAPAFPLASPAVAPLRAKAEAAGSGDFTPMLAGQAAALGRRISARELTRALAAEASERLRRLAG